MIITATINTDNATFHDAKDCKCDGGDTEGCNFAKLSGIERLLTPMVADIAGGQTGRSFLDPDGHVIGEWEATEDEA